MQAIKIFISAIMWGALGVAAAIAITICGVYSTKSTPHAPDAQGSAALAILVLGPAGFAVGVAYGIIRVLKREEKRNKIPPQNSQN